jgi:beta-lactamase regulating signal transducer with metallopeptidase domain
MDPTPVLGFWWRFLAVLAIEMSLIAFAAFAFQSFTRSAVWRRTIWQAAVVAALVLLACELSGASRFVRAVASSRRASAPRAIPEEQVRFSVTVLDAPAIADPARLPSAPPAIANAPHPEQRQSWWPAIVWCTGFAALLSRMLLVRLVFFLCGRQHPLSDPVISRRIHELARSLGIRRHVRVKEIRGLRAPVAFGLLRPTVGLPEGFCDSFTPKQQEVMLIHELAHLASRDTLWYWLADLLTAFFWWHPLGWWMRARLHAATETAADEACLLVEDGPVALAESLVQLGASLLQPARIASLNIGGNGFRSSLGRRVERLIKLHGNKWRPPAPLPSAVAKVIGPVFLLAVVIGALAYAFPAQMNALGKEWRDSVAARAIASVSQLVGNDSDSRVAALIGDAKIFFEKGKLEHAEALIDEALKIDPANKEALDCLNLVQEARSRKRTEVDQVPSPAENKAKSRELERILPAKPSGGNAWDGKPPILAGNESAGQPVESYARTNIVYSGKGRRAVYAKLESIRLGNVMYDNVPLGDVAKDLTEEVRKRDPEGRGIHFIVSSNDDAPVDPATGLPLGPRIQDTLVRIMPALTDVTVGQALDAIVKVANQPIKFAIEDYGVVFSPRTTEMPTLYTRTFKVDQNSIMRALEGMFRTEPGRDPLFPLVPTYATQPISRWNLDVARQYFLLHGVDLTPPKTVFWNDRLGVMFVRATLEDLDRMEQAIQKLNSSQLTIEVKIAEMPESGRRALGLDWLGGGDGTVISTISTNQLSTSLMAASPEAENRAMVLVDPQFRLVLRALEQRSGVDILSAPKVTTLSGRQAQIKVVTVRTLVMGVAGNPANQNGVVNILTSKEEMGPVIDVTPVVDADGYTIRLTVIAAIREFLGYDPTSETVKVIGDDGKVQSMARPLPRFRVCRATAFPVLLDGQTAAIELGTFNAKLRIAFITATIIDPAGNRVHNENDGPFRIWRIPPQRKAVDPNGR